MSTLERTETFKKASADFRQHLPDLSSPRFTTAKKQDAHQYVAKFRSSRIPPWLYNLTQTWEELLEEPFTGVTVDGNVRKDLFEQQDTGINTQPIYDAVQQVLEKCTPDQKTKLQYQINSREWRAWSNPEFLLRDFGLRLDELPEELATSILGVVETSFSAEGYQKALAAMRINHFLGELCEIPKIMNKYSYNFLVFGEPSSDKNAAWGWSLYGHHLCLSVFFKGNDIVISPTFTGAEPNIIDDGPYAGTEILHTEGKLGLQLMQSLKPEQQKVAQIYVFLKDTGMENEGNLKHNRWNQDDQRHLCGAFRDNRIVPYEGVKVSDLDTLQQNLILDIVNEFVLYLPDAAREKRKEQIQRHFDETFFSWIGGYEEGDAYYYRIQSPVIICEFDHHSGVFLTNQNPAPFHTHTIVRTPNGGDYGNAIRAPDERVP